MFFQIIRDDLAHLMRLACQEEMPGGHFSVGIDQIMSQADPFGGDTAGLLAQLALSGRQRFFIRFQVAATGGAISPTSYC